MGHYTEKGCAVADETVNNAKKEFEQYMKKWVIHNNRFDLGIDVGCGTSRVDDMIVSVDRQADYKYAHAQLVWDCENLDLFADGKLDFIFSSHCLEDFENIDRVFFNWWRKLRTNGLMLLLLPDMQGGRYPTVEQGGNPSHRTNTGKLFMVEMLKRLSEREGIKYEVLQQDTIPHNESSSIDFVIRKLS